MGKNIKAILMDSGRVLNGPATGDWFITPKFFEHIHEKNFTGIPRPRRRAAFAKAMTYILQQSLITTEEEEYRHFLEYYRIVFGELPELQVGEEVLQRLAWDYVHDYEKYTFFEDALDIIPQLHKEFKLAVVSDAWPSLENVFRKAEVRDYFSSFVISSQLGITKPHQGMYETALKELGVEPEEAVFIDDSSGNCDGAKGLGIHTLWLCRDYRAYIYNKLTGKEHTVIRSLREVPKALNRI